MIEHAESLLVLIIALLFPFLIFREEIPDWKIIKFIQLIGGVLFFTLTIFRFVTIPGIRPGGYFLEYWIQPNSNVIILGLFLGAILAVFNEGIGDYFSKKKADNRSSFVKVVEAKAINHMGSSSSNFDDKSLDAQSISIVKLTHAAFGHLDRQVSASIEANLNVKPNQRKNVQRLLAEVIDQKPSIADALRPLKRMQQGGHNTAYGIFDKMCMIAAHSQRYSQGTLNNLISIAQQLGLSQEEIYYLFQKSRLAV